MDEDDARLVAEIRDGINDVRGEIDSLAKRLPALRDYFAGQALAGLLAWDGEASHQYEPAQVARLAYEYADAMLAERIKDAPRSKGG